ncbi:exopolyphosphatase [Enterovibrio norvegicus FF-33]|uniref:exopolyphosphatase n=1 Tax=Enterovibrio norvegicus TaxID=188144 RepID=UPI0002FAF407|nr:exopolyphosphatase [Enterovibrio norvegicus]OEE69000.1 exopolyphosphatase [Enterovibrio norvegicus FF-33]
MSDTTNPEKPREIAAIDLGSNSFHMVVARVVGQGLQIVSRHKQRVRLASGLDNHQNLDNAAINRGIECLAMFAERLQGFDQENVRVAATFTLREAKNSHVFLQRAQLAFPYPIEIIPGVEEARLIYLGVSHTQPGEDRKLVVDIGGGSTELVIGKNFNPALVNSKRMGCVSFNERFFKDGEISPKRFASAQLAAELKLEGMARQYIKYGWEEAVGSSGTIKAIREVLIASGHDDGIITRKRLDGLIEQVLAFKSSDELVLPGLSPDRQPVFAAGLALLLGVFHALNIEKMVFSDGALREGLLYEMEDRFQHSDIRSRTAADLAERYHIDQDHAERVQQVAENVYLQAEPQLGPKKAELVILMSWAALLHEVGLSISHSGFHKHSAYILQNTNLSGFNQEQQTVLATLTRFHRKALKLGEMPEFALFKLKHIFPLIRALRLACVLNVQRSGDPLPDVKLEANDDHWSLVFPEHWLSQNRLLAADLETEQAYWAAVGWTLTIAK